MNDLTTRFLNNFTQWHEVGLTLIKTTIAIGVLCLVAYLLTIGYIPSDISFGDTLIFFINLCCLFNCLCWIKHGAIYIWRFLNACGVLHF